MCNFLNNESGFDWNQIFGSSDLKKIKLRQKYRKQINCVQNMTKISFLQTEKLNLTCSFMIFKALFPYNEVKD